LKTVRFFVFYHIATSLGGGRLKSCRKCPQSNLSCFVLNLREKETRDFFLTYQSIYDQFNVICITVYIKGFIGENLEKQYSHLYITVSWGDSSFNSSMCLMYRAVCAVKKYNIYSYCCYLLHLSSKRTKRYCV